MSKIRFFVLGFISLIIPFFLIMTSVRLLLSPLFLQVEYRMPGFPPDTYGFTLEDRLKWSAISVDYLVNDQGISYLAEQRLDNGTSLYNERELSHMVDVKTLIQKMVLAWDLLAFILVASALVFWRTGWMGEFWRAIARGGWFTLVLIALILAGVFASFSALFTEFHRIFFSGDTWLFLYSDSLIRLFPMRFWQDAFILMGAFSVAGGLLATFGGRALYRKLR